MKAVTNRFPRLRFLLACVLSSTLKMEATRSSETPVFNKPTQSHIPEDGVLHKQLLVPQVELSSIEFLF
jgi:hypothetical protein